MKQVLPCNDIFPGTAEVMLCHLKIPKENEVWEVFEKNTT
jgi:hypothetical protein